MDSNGTHTLLRIAVTGSSGLIGRALIPALEARGDRIDRVVRRTATPGSGEISWDIGASRIDEAALEGVGAVVHLAGKPIGEGRWSDEVKREILDSRRKGTGLLSEALARLANPPRVLVCSGAVGYYGDRGEELLSEESGSGTGFLAEVCRAWEEAAEPARRAGIRVVNLRIGIVLAAAGGALPRMLTPFKLGAGGRVGSGKQYWSWISLDDVVGAIAHVLDSAVAGPLNVVAPAPVTNAEFTKTLGRVLGRPTFLPLPGAALKAAFGEMGEQILLAGQRVSPAKLQADGYRFAQPELEPALRHVLDR